MGYLSDFQAWTYDFVRVEPASPWYGGRNKTGMRRMLPITLLAVALLSTGCQKQWADANWTDAHYQGASLVFDSAAQQSVNVQRPDGVLPWYAARKDRLPTTTAGYESRTVRHTTRIVRDYNRVGGYRPHVHHHERTYTVEHGVTVD